MSQNMTLGKVEAEITGGLVEMEIDIANRTVIVGRKDATEEELVSLPFIFTPTGFRL